MTEVVLVTIDMKNTTTNSHSTYVNNNKGNDDNS